MKPYNKWNCNFDFKTTGMIAKCKTCNVMPQELSVSCRFFWSPLAGPEKPWVAKFNGHNGTCAEVN